MQDSRITFLASAVVVATGVLWGFYWVPVRHLSAAALPGAWGTCAVTVAAMLLLAPVALIRRSALARADRLGLASVALGGAAFALYSIGLVYGRVAIIILLFFLTPVWSTLIGRYLLGWATPRMRLYAIVAGLVGLVVMLGAGGTLPVPRGTGEWLALASGLLWSVATTGIRTRSNLPAGPAALVFAIGAAAASVALAPMLEPVPAAVPSLAGTLTLAAGTAALWWGVSMIMLMWATARLEPARVGILLMTEVLVGALSAALLAGERLGPMEIAGGALVLCAGVLEVWPVRGGRAVRPRRGAT